MLHTISTGIELRPLRVGFFVDPTDREMLSQVLRLATCMWGGMMCPLIPVMDKIPTVWRDKNFPRMTPSKITQGYLRFFEPDVFVETLKGQFETAGFEPRDIKHNPRRYHAFSDLIKTVPGRISILDIGISMHQVYNHIFKKEFQFRKRKNPHILEFNNGDPIGEAFFETCYGVFPSSNTLHYIPELYREVFAAKKVNSDIDNWARIERGEAGYPFFYTIRELKVTPNSWNSNKPLIFIFDPLSPTDVIDFWNTRLVMPNVIPVNIHWLKQSRNLILKMVQQNHRPLPSNLNGAMIRTTIQLGRSIDHHTARRY